MRFYPSYRCLSAGKYLIMIAYIEGEFPNCMKLLSFEKCLDDNENCDSRNMSIVEDYKLLILNAFDDDEEDPSKVSFSVTFEGPPECYTGNYIKLYIKESFKFKTIEIAHVII